MQLIDKINDTELYANRATNDENGNQISTTYVTTDSLSAELKNITDLIPEATTTENQLADKAYVDFNTEQIAAKYLARDIEGNPFLSYAEFTDPDVVFYYAGTSAEPTKNDYVLINGDESIPEEEWLSELPPITRYWYTGTTWSFQYIVNNSPLNATQLAAINSGITKPTVEAVEALPLDELLTLPTEVNEYLHDQNCIQFKENDNVAMVIMDELSKHTFPYSCKFMSKDSGISKTLKQLPLEETKLGTNLQSLAGFIIHVYCMGGEGGNVLPNYTRYAYLELSSQARNVDDVCRFKYWCRLANNSGTNRPKETDTLMQLNWQRALTDNNYGFVTVKELKTNENIVERIMTDFSIQYKPYHYTYSSSSNAITSTIKGIPTDLVNSFQLHAYTSEGDNGLLRTAKWKGLYHFELIGHNSSGIPLKYIGYMNYTGTTKPSTWPIITWEKVLSEAVTAVRI